MEEKIKEKKLIPQTKKKKSRKIFFIIFGLLFLIAVSIFLWSIFGRKPSFTGERINFDISAPGNIKSNELFIYEVSYENNEAVALQDVEINLVYPEGFSFEKSNPDSENFTGNRWYFKSIPPKSKGKITISGKLLGNQDDLKRCQTTLRYTPSNFNASFTEEAQAITKLEKINLLISSDIPKIISKDSNLEYLVTIKNEENFDLSNLKIQLDYPQGFELKSTDPNPKQENNIWIFDKISPGEELKIKIAEKVFGELEEKKFLNVKAGLLGREDQEYIQAEKKFEIKIAKIEADLSYEVLGQKKLVVNQGDLLEFKIHYKNTGTESLPNIKVESEIDTSLFDKESFLIEGGMLSDKKVIWDKSGISSFANLEKGAEGDLIFRAKVLQDISSNDQMKNLSLESKAKITASDQDKGISYLKESNEIEVKINTQVTLNLEGRYYDSNGEKVGSGPLPPKVGEATIYRIYLSLSNTLNDVSDGRIEIFLPMGVSWTGVKTVSAGTLLFVGDRMIWDIGKILAGSGKENKILEANFEVGITPDESQVGKTVTLVSKAGFSSKDTFTGKDINFEVGSVSTDLTNDPKASGKGVVVK
jgi:hypothetical protein